MVIAPRSIYSMRIDIDLLTSDMIAIPASAPVLFDSVAMRMFWIASEKA
jgi:hypothetical protein